MLIIFINPIAENIEISLVEYSGNTSKIQKKISITKGRDYDEFPDSLIEILDQFAIESIWCITGPGAFTRMRIVTLTLNSLVFSRPIRLKGVHFFEVIDTENPILQVNDGEFIIYNHEKIPTLVQESELNHEVMYTGYVRKKDFTLPINSLKFKEEFSFIQKKFALQDHNMFLIPIYYKEPNITGSKNKPLT